VRPGGLGLTLLTWAIALVIFFPILWTVVTAFKNEADAAATPPVFLFHATLDNFRAVFNASYFSYFKNTVILAGGSTLLALVLGLPAAYSLAFHPGKQTPKVLSWVLSTKMLPAVGALIPLIVIYKRVGLFDSRLGMILLYGAFNLPLVIWMMRSFFSDLPKEILEASVVDGAGFLRIFMTSEGLFFAKMSAASTMAVAPVILAGWLAQRSLVRGLTFGAVK
jgi:sorbitol/mannitol transport system permease protein